jgi:hypothetical protein
MVYIINKLKPVPTTRLKSTYGEVLRDRLSHAILKFFFYRRKSAKTKNIKCKDIEKLQTIVDHYHNRLSHFDLVLHKNTVVVTNEGIRQWKAIWKGVEEALEGKEYFYEKARWCRKTLDKMYLDALEANACLDALEANACLGQTGTIPENINLEDQEYLAYELESFIEDCNRYILNKALVGLEIRCVAPPDVPVANATYEVQSSSSGDTPR